MRTVDDTFILPRESPYASAYAPAVPAPRPPDGRTILVGTNGRAESVAAIHVAFALARRRGARPHVLRAFDAGAFSLPGATPSILLLADDLLSGEPHEARKRDLALFVGEQIGSIPEWPVRVRVGSAAGSIVREAESIGAAMIVVGLRHHGTIDRLLRDETSLHVARGARVPVLAVAAGLESMPRRVIVGVDFSRASLHAARAALSVIDERGTLVLAHVRPDVGDQDGGESCEGIGVIEREGVAAAFERLRSELSAPPAIAVETIVIDGGEPATELRALALRTGADLVAIGSHRHERVERWLLGSVTTDLLRDGRTSVLVVPPAPPTRSVRRCQ